MADDAERPQPDRPARQARGSCARQQKQCAQRRLTFVLLPDDSYVRVLGLGALDTVRVSQTKGEPPKKIHATWTRELDVNGDTNKVDADGSCHGR